MLQKFIAHKNVLESFIWSSVLSIFSRGAPLVVSIILSHKIGDLYFAQYTYIFSTINALLVFTGLGLPLFLLQRLSQSGDVLNDYNLNVISHALYLSTFSWVVVISTFAFLVHFGCISVSNGIDLYTLGLLFVALLINSYLPILQSICSAITKFKTNATVGCVTAISWVLYVFLIYKGDAVFNLLAVYVSLTFLALLLQFTLTNKHLCIKLTKPDMHFCMRLVVESFPIFASSTLNIPVVWLVGLTVLGGGANYSQYTQYGILDQIKMVLVFVPSLMLQIFIPWFNHFNKITCKHGDRFALITFVASSCISIASAGAVFLMKDYIISAYNGKLDGCEFPLGVLAIATVFMTANNVLGQYFLSYGRFKYSLMTNAFWAIFFLTTFFVSGFIWGAIDAYSISLLVSYFIILLFQCLMLYLFKYRRGRIESRA